MTGGRYTTFFIDDDNSLLRSYLYKLENLELLKVRREISKQTGYFKYSWSLTTKGQEFISNNKFFSELWDKKNIVELCRELVCFFDIEQL